MTVQEETEREAERRRRIKEAVEKDIGSVLLRDEIIFGAVATGDGRYGIQSGAYPTGLVKQACFDLLFRAMMMFQHVELSKALKAESEKRIVVPDADKR